MTGGELTLGALLVRLDEQEREITAQAEAAREKIAELTALLDELGTAAEEIRITRKTLLELPDPPPPAPPAAKLPEHPAYQQILAAFAEMPRPMRARDLCQVLDLDLIPRNIESTRHKLKRLVGCGILAEPEPGLFSQPRP